MNFRTRLTNNANEFDSIVTDMLKAVDYAIEDKEKWETIAEDYIKSEGAWRWVGDGSDNLESLTCPILITPNQLRELLHRAKKVDRCDYS